MKEGTTPAQRRHIDHEMSQAVRIATELRRSRRTSPDLVVRSMRVAYAAHFRVLMEFFHEGRPNRTPHPRDLTVTDVLPPGITPTSWTRTEERRFAAADKLLGHLSKDRVYRTAMRREWGDAADDRLIVRHIQRLFQHQPLARTWFPETAVALDARGQSLE